jgi:ribosomal-protein-alanine N-acetyltransferase
VGIGIKVDIAPMTPAEISAVMEIEKSSHLEPWSRESFLEELKRSSSCVFLAKVSPGCCSVPSSGGGDGCLPGNVAGYLCFWIVADEIQILNVAVHRGCRRNGVARQLMLHALRAGVQRGARVAVLEVRKSNTAAQALYSSLGFKRVGERPDYYGVVKEPAVFMELEPEGLFALPEV